MFDHLKNNCQTWDGLSYTIMDIKEAKKLEKQGLLQITTNLQAKDLKTAAEFNEVREARAEDGPPGMIPPKKRRGKNYKTREMRAET